MKALLERGDLSCHSVAMRERNTTELTVVALSIIGLVMGLAAVKAGASLLVILGMVLICYWIGDCKLEREIIPVTTENAAVT